MRDLTDEEFNGMACDFGRVVARWAERLGLKGYELDPADIGDSHGANFVAILINSFLNEEGLND